MRQLWEVPHYQAYIGFIKLNFLDFCDSQTITVIDCEKWNIVVANFPFINIAPPFSCLHFPRHLSAESDRKTIGEWNLL